MYYHKALELLIKEKKEKKEKQIRTNIYIYDMQIKCNQRETTRIT